ncbi:MAG: hypothetical protein KAU35_05485 [candidate division Zixibacteria bacterium]|nr:hypothetical protein [candidate division Zixibacteria bacterium]
MRRLIVITCAVLCLAGTVQGQICGDIDNSGSLPIDIADLVWLDDYMFNQGPELPDVPAANMAGCAGVNIHDLVYMSNYMFHEGPEPIACDDHSPCPPAASGSISLSHVDGLSASGGLEIGTPITFYLRLVNGETTMGGITNGFRVYSETAQWGTTVGATTGTLGGAQFDRFSINGISLDGTGADTVGFGGYRINTPGLPAGFDDTTYTIQIGPIDFVYDGSIICLDSSYYPPAGEWLWSDGYDLYAPTWDGPHCFTVDPCNPDLTAPTFTTACPDDISIECDAEVPAPVDMTATDNCDPAPVVTFKESTVGDVITRTWTATDASGNNTVCEQTITIEDTAPPQFVEECPADLAGC